jgi:hypothetical protein
MLPCVESHSHIESELQTPTETSSPQRRRQLLEPKSHMQRGKTRQLSVSLAKNSQFIWQTLFFQLHIVVSPAQTVMSVITEQVARHWTLVPSHMHC